MSTAPLAVAALTPPAPAGDVSAAASTAPRGRATWSGLLKVSLLAFPVKAYPVAVSGQESHFHQLHAGCGQRIRYEKHCPVHGKVDAGAIASGYPYAPDQHLLLDEAELDKLRPAKDKALALEHFLEPAHLDPLLFSGRSLYLLPDGVAAQHPYQVLAEGLHERRKWGLGWIVLGGHRHLALLRPAGRVLTLHVLHYPTQLRASTALEAELHNGAVSNDESKLAAMLLDASSPATIPWSQFRDDLAESLAALVQARLQGRTLPAPAPEEVPILSLLDALKQSVAAATVKSSSTPAPDTAVPGKGKRKPSRRSA